MFVIDDVNRGAFHFVTKCLSLSLSLCLSVSLSLAVGRTMDRHFVKKTEAEAKVEAPFRLSPLTRSVNTSALSFPRRGFPDRFGVDDDDDGGGGGDVEFQMRRLSFFCTITDRHANDVTNAVTQLHSCLPACLPASWFWPYFSSRKRKAPPPLSSSSSLDERNGLRVGSAWRGVWRRKPTGVDRLSLCVANVGPFGKLGAKTSLCSFSSCCDVTYLVYHVRWSVRCSSDRASLYLR